jgi:hypothetical protein
MDYHKQTYKEATFLMQVYNQYEDTFSSWPKAIEASWQSTGSSPRTDVAGNLAPKLPHLGLSDILLIASLVHMPSRPHGLITWLANYYQISRVSAYDLAARVNARLLPPPQPAMLVAPEPTIAAEAVSKARLDRTILATLLPGKAAIRPTQVILQEAFSTTRSVGYINDLRLTAGRRAGEKLAAVDYSKLGPVLVLRDETYFHEKPILVLVEPVTTTIVGIHACNDRQAKTWAAALLQAQKQGVKIAGVVEDMAKMYPKSLAMADMEEVPQQKDIWHLLREGQRRRRIVERAAYRLMSQVDKLEQQLRDQWDETLFLKQYIPTVAKEEMMIAEHDQMEICLNQLPNALSLVDGPHGELLDLETCRWLFKACLAQLDGLTQKTITAFARQLRKYQEQLLSFFSWTAAAIAQWQEQLQATLLEPNAGRQFRQAVVRRWWLAQALINGHHSYRSAAQEATALLQASTAANPLLAELDHKLCQILDAAGRSSSLVEAVNSLLKAFLRPHKSFQDNANLQAYLNLFALWHNMRVYDSRCKRGGQSPFQLAGIDLGSDDWLTVLGYPPAN